MTDYKNLKLIATSNPHIRGSETTRSIMLDVIIAMCPALIWAIIYFGVEALLLTAVSVAGSVFFEWAYRKIMNKPQSVGDLSAVVTGMLLAFVCPATTPLWMVLIGDFFAIVVVKQLFGGIVKNFLNPALAGRAALLASYAGSMTTWLPAGVKAAIGGGLPADVVSAATPLAYLKTGDLEGLKQIASVGDMFLGKVGGSMGQRIHRRVEIPSSLPRKSQDRLHHRQKTVRKTDCSVSHNAKTRQSAVRQRITGIRNHTDPSRRSLGNLPEARRYAGKLDLLDRRRNRVKLGRRRRRQHRLPRSP